VEIQTRLIRSDELPKDKIGMDRMISGSSIILCTLSMVSNPALYENGTFDVVPLERLIIDEASQINVFEFMVCYWIVSQVPVAHSCFSSSYLKDSKRILKKFVSSAIQNSACFPLFLFYNLLTICPFIKVSPHGQEDVPGITTIFDLEHLKEAGNCHFLNIQCEFPVMSESSLQI